jgi:glycosyltransferase involved in cell wall biosynthesis
MAEFVSILMPCYNAEKWLKETIDSALSQTWPNKEIIIVDDGSTDNSLQIAKQYESATIKVISQENKGGSAARNKALECAQGDYIQWLDADDILAPDKIEKQMKVARDIADQKVLLSCSWGRFYYRYWKAKFVEDSLWRDLNPVEWLIISFSEGSWMSNSAWLVSRTLTELAGPWDERLFMDQDGEYLCRVLTKSNNVVFVPEAREYVRRSNLESVGNSLSRRSLESHFLSKTLCIGYLLSVENSERTREACVMLLQNSRRFYYPAQTDLMKKADDLAHELGGTLSRPVYNRRLAFAERIFGFTFANIMRRLWSQAKDSVTINWDKLLYDLSKK